MYRITRQSVLAGQIRDSAIFDPAQSTFGGNPNGAFPVQIKIVDPSSSHSIGGPVGRAHFPVLIKDHPSLPRRYPHSPTYCVDQQGLQRTVKPEPLRGNVFSDPPSR